MDILFLNHNVAWKGGFFRAYHWGRYLSRMGHSVSLMTISENSRSVFTETIKEGVRIIKSPDLFPGKLRTGWDPYDTLRRIIYLKDRKFDIIHCVDTRPNVVLPGLFLKKKNGGKLIMDWGDWWGRGGTISERSDSMAEKLFEPIETFFEEKFRKYADGHVVLSDILKDRCIELGVTSPIVKIPHGADTVQIKPKDKLAARKKLNFAPNDKIIGYLGAIFPNDSELLILSFRIVKKLLPELKLLIIGNCNAAFPADLVLEKSIIKTGKLDFEEMTDNIAVCDFMLLPLRDTLANRGRWPSKVCDYLSAGKPVIGTQVGDISKLLTNSKAGFLSADDPVSYANTIYNSFLLNNLKESEIAARTMAEEELSWEILTKKLELFYITLNN
jgi:glycosyltransferase involved in cell wall biosynthesis